MPDPGPIRVAVAVCLFSNCCGCCSCFSLPIVHLSPRLPRLSLRTLISDRPYCTSWEWSNMRHKVVLMTTTASRENNNAKIGIAKARFNSATVAIAEHGSQPVGNAHGRRRRVKMCAMCSRFLSRSSFLPALSRLVRPICVSHSISTHLPSAQSLLGHQIYYYFHSQLITRFTWLVQFLTIASNW